MLNSIVIQGRIAHTPELRQTQGGTSVLGMSVAVQRSRKDPDGNYPTDFFECTFWGKLAENAAKFFQKGDHLSLFSLDGVKCGVIICYDIRFPELTRTMALEGMDVLFVVSE